MPVCKIGEQHPSLDVTVGSVLHLTDTVDRAVSVPVSLLSLHVKSFSICSTFFNMDCLEAEISFLVYVAARSDNLHLLM